jgi:hypothetical protein
MKLKKIEIETNDDGTFQVECYSEGKGMMCCGEKLTYSAKNIEDALSKIDEAKKEFEGMKGEKPKEEKKDVVKEFMDGEED